ncbi:MAG: hypothetical protein ONB16_11395 [candidate division KSB1 bacterium]|nr:hypothetical protein [candidate division KSB1 bacterium]MDZ7317856.1 hypothetical protein [candidate division KSB1 bacterium]MDZ7340350.1 hypothetical protein [candidate division KSB1 bacterium]
MAFQPKISIIVIAAHQKEILMQTLKRLGQLSHPSYEIVVISMVEELDDAAVLNLNGRLRWFQLPSDESISPRNWGVQLARGEIVVFCDDAIIPTQQWLQAHERNYSDSSIGSVAGKIVENNGEIQSHKVGQINWLTGQLVENFHSNTRTRIDFGYGFNLSFRKEALLKVHGFDTRFMGTGILDDVDACLRVKAIGYEIVFEPDASVIHLEPTSITNAADYWQRWYFWYGHNSSLLFYKNFSYRVAPIYLAYRIVELVAASLKYRQLNIFRRGLQGLWNGYKSYRFRDGNSFIATAPTNRPAIHAKIARSEFAVSMLHTAVHPPRA